MSENHERYKILAGIISMLIYTMQCGDLSQSAAPPPRSHESRVPSYAEQMPIDPLKAPWKQSVWPQLIEAKIILYI